MTYIRDEIRLYGVVRPVGELLHTLKMPQANKRSASPLALCRAGMAGDRAAIVFHRLVGRLNSYAAWAMQPQPKMAVVPGCLRVPRVAAGVFKMQLHPHRRIFEQQRGRLDED